MKPVAESSKAADNERFEAEVGVWKPTKENAPVAVTTGAQDKPGKTPQGHSTS